MSLYGDVSNELLQDKDALELYRFQGGNSYHLLSIRNQNHSYNRNGYVYLSGSVDHHKYFMVKRLRQLINEEILKNEPYRLTCNHLNNLDSYNTIKALILNSDKINDLYSTKLICQREFFHLIKENSFNQREKISSNSIERVDRKVYGGGYGVSSNWRELLNLLTFFKASQRIDRQSLVDLIANMRRTGKFTSKENIKFLLDRKDKYSFEINKTLESDFTKYEIIEYLERIIDSKECSEDSNLSKNGKETIKTIVGEYERTKSKTLRLLSNYSEFK